MTSTSYALAPALLALPVAGAAVLLLGGRRTDRFGHVIGTLASVAAFVVAAVVWVQMIGRDEADRPAVQKLWTFVHTGGFRVDVGLQLDQLSIVFALLITGVGSLIHVYSIAYMEHDAHRRRFFAYLNLFVAAMLLLVLASDYLLVYVGWEGVGLASYLLIGFWSHNPPYATAAKKAFVANRVGDIGMSLAIVMMFTTFGATDFARVLPNAGSASDGRLTAIGLLLLLAACGKSAQLPLQSWLGDAMAGPTPVSALIHAATMVTAGVYLIVRSGAIFDESPDARLVVTIVGAATLLFGALIGTAKDDVKKALAASTMSQIGYMVLAAGLGPAGYAIAIFHLLTHGFFKAGLFLGAGSVMHAMGDRTDMRRFGGLWRVMPVTGATFGLGYLAIIGCPPFSGFWSKDKIIEAAFDKGGTSGWILGLVALLGAGITAFYMTRVFVMTFLGPRRWRDDVHPHEAPTLMTAPMVVLALGSVFLGGVLTIGATLQNWLEPAVGKSAEEGAHTMSPLVLSLLTLLVVLGGVAGAAAMYARREVPLTAPVAGPLTVAARNDLYQDAVNEAVLMRPGQYVTRSLVFGDLRGVDGLVNGFAAVIGGTSGRLRRLQTGFVRSYALSVLGGAVLLAGALLIVRI
ncbi:NADH-quinone oxidoreductase subunit L [Motilibacter peucedani]|uniref:NADH-quinone oxidoreductase subunit L n=1 Tax=Motilibacter peucedani TaxID=598650 RepID=A0A420XL01_9ACTN|nr:NADH-quinone oxidoreductase subunit L [Motilibacter peucedani]RKS69216.1 NADH-quinone oxidoreductase subunit L [Motilibacter peucedani]